MPKYFMNEIYINYTKARKKKSVPQATTKRSLESYLKSYRPEDLLKRTGITEDWKMSVTGWSKAWTEKEDVNGSKWMNKKNMYSAWVGFDGCTWTASGTGGCAGVCTWAWSCRKGRHIGLVKCPVNAFPNPSPPLPFIPMLQGYMGWWMQCSDLS